MAAVRGTLFTWVTGLAVALCVQSACADGPFPPATSATPLPVLQSRAQTGDTSAMMALGALALGPWRTPEDMPSALQWFRQAAAAGRVDAMVRLSDLYGLQLRDQPGADAESKRWMEAAKSALAPFAEKGDLTAELHLAYLCDQSLDGDCAIRWFRKAADGGSAEAMEQLGFHYQIPWDLPEENANEAFHWTSEGAAHGNVKAMLTLSDYYARGYGVARDQAQAASFRSKAYETLRSQAAGGDQKAMLDLARAQLRGDVTGTANAPEAIRLLSSAANAGNFLAASMLASDFADGQSGFPRDVTQSRHWLAVATAIGFPLDQYNGWYGE